MVNIYAAEKSRLSVTTMKAMNLQDDMPSFPIDNFKEHHVLVPDLTSMQDATQNFSLSRTKQRTLEARAKLYFFSRTHH